MITQSPLSGMSTNVLGFSYNVELIQFHQNVVYVTTGDRHVGEERKNYTIIFFVILLKEVYLSLPPYGKGHRGLVKATSSHTSESVKFRRS